MRMGEIISLLRHEARTLRNLTRHRAFISSKQEEDIVSQFHLFYYNSYLIHQTWDCTFWLGVKTMKCPLDLWIYQEIIHERRPDLIIETGTESGGSALYLACICDLVKKGKVITVDIEDKTGRPCHPRIQYLLGSSTSEEIVAQVRRQIGDHDTVMVILDSDHSMEHVLKELRMYSGFVSPGSYLIVEDTNINGHPVYPEFGPGPMEAVDAFLEENKLFIVDRSREKFSLTFNPKGYLRRVR